MGVPSLRASRAWRLTTKPRGVADLEALDAVFRALAHQSRRTILVVLLARGGEMTSGEIASRFEHSWPTVTRHLQVLEEAGLVQVVLRGRERLYALDRTRIVRVAGQWLARFRTARDGSSATEVDCGATGS